MLNKKIILIINMFFRHFSDKVMFVNLMNLEYKLFIDRISKVIVKKSFYIYLKSITIFIILHIICNLSNLRRWHHSWWILTSINWIVILVQYYFLYEIFSNIISKSLHISTFFYLILKFNYKNSLIPYLFKLALNYRYFSVRTSYICTNLKND